jgi:hypothetical protein
MSADEIRYVPLAITWRRRSTRSMRGARSPRLARCSQPVVAFNPRVDSCSFVNELILVVSIGWSRGNLSDL